MDTFTPPPSTSSSLSNEELDAFLEELGLLENEKSELELAPSLDTFIEQTVEEKNAASPLQNVPLSMPIEKQKKRILTKWDALWLPCLFFLGFSFGWALKPSPPPQRPVEIIGEEIIRLLEKIHQPSLPLPAPTLPASPPSNSSEAPPADLPPSQSEESIEQSDFSVA